jgi:hypothetical protein
VLSPVRASGLPLTKTFDEPPTIAPPQAVLSPMIAAGFRLMKTSGEPCTTGPPFIVVSPWRAALLPPTITSGLPWMIGPLLCDGLCALATTKKHATPAKMKEESQQETLAPSVEVIDCHITGTQPIFAHAEKDGSEYRVMSRQE